MKKLFVQLIIILVSTLSFGQDFEGKVEIFDITKIDGTDYINKMKVYYDDVELISRYMKNYDYTKCYELEGKVFLKCSDGNSTICDAKDRTYIDQIIESCIQKKGNNITGIYFP